MILCDVAREDASVIVSDLRELDVDTEGSIAIEHIDSAISDAAESAERAAAGKPGDAVVWEEVESRTSENIELNANFLAFMALACLIASVGIFLDSPILIVGAMVVGPEFGPIAGLCVAVVQRRPRPRASARSPPSRSASRSGSPPPACSPSRSTPTDLTPNDFTRQRTSADRLHLAPGRVLVHRRLRRRDGRGAVADLGKVGRVDRGPRSR